MEEILRVDFIFHPERRSIFLTKSQLPNNGVESTTDRLHQFDMVRSCLRKLRFGLQGGRGADRHRGARLRIREDWGRFLHLWLLAGWVNWMHGRLRFKLWWLRRQVGERDIGPRGLN